MQGITRALIVFALASASRESSAQDSAEANAALKARLRTEILMQRAAWQKLEDEHPPFNAPADVEPNTKRRAHSLCLAGVFYRSSADIAENRNYLRPTRLPSVSAVRGACPWWIPPKVSGRLGRTHEYRGQVPTPAQMVPFSEGLVADLDDAAKSSTEDIWPISQLVRVLTENEQYARARDALDRCNVEKGWCTLLRIHVEQESYNYRAADSLVRDLLRSSSPESREILVDAVAIVRHDDLRRYMDFKADSIETNYWWLAQPFFSDGGNARRSEHISRLVRNTLAQQLEIDVFYNTSTAIGGDAIQLMRQKYGWPTHQAWVGKAEEDLARGYWATKPPPPYSAPEYSWPRTSTAPRLRAAMEPLTVTDDDFSLGPPDSISYFRWWPSEFFRHKEGKIIPFPSQQRAMLRRDTTMLVIIAANIQSESGSSLIDSIGNAPVRGELWFSPQPDSASRLSQVTTKLGQKLVLQGEVRSAGIVSGEFRVNANGLAGGRTRAGVSEVRTLASLPAGTCELSVPMLFEPDSLKHNQPLQFDGALLGSLTLHNPTRVGIAWESYGARPGESTTVAAHIGRASDSTQLRKPESVLGVIRDRSHSAGTTWAEPDTGRSAVAITASVPLIQRHLTIDVNTLKHGDYLLQVEVRNAQCGTLRSEQFFMVTR